MKYVILNDGETYTSLKGCAIYDSDTDKLYSVRINKKIEQIPTNNRWDKGISEINDINEDNGIPGK